MNLTQEEQIKDKILTRLDIIQTSILLSPQINKSINLIIDCIKKGNKISASKHYFKNRGRLYIQKKAVELALKLILKILR